ncbi:MAG: CPBP family glutamic-type intramembrane protease [Planctomycetota bacterium]
MRTPLEVLRVELLQLARDRRALFSAVVLPALLYPLLFLGMGKLESVGEETMAERTIKARMDLEGVADATREAFLAAFVDEGPVTIEDVDASRLSALEDDEERRLAAREILGLDGDESSADVLVVGVQDDGAAGQERMTFDLWYNVKNDDSQEGRSRARGALRDLEKEVAIQRREELLGGDPAAGLDAAEEDVATAEDTSGAALGKWLPFIVLLVMISGGAYAALAVFAGEREAGTLETLLVQPVDHRSIATGKFLAVFVAGTATLLVNLGSLVACVVSGIADMDAFGGASGGISAGRLAALGVELPACLLLCAVLCLVCGRAKTFREGQLLVFPVTLLTALPTAIVLRPDAELSVFWAMVPFSGSGLALRDGLAGDLSLPLAALVVASHLGWTWLALVRLAGILDAEKVLGGGGDAKAESHLQQAGGRHGVRWGFAVVMTVYLIAMSVQRVDIDVGLWFTFWVLLPAFALAIAWTAPRAEGERRNLAGALGLQLPRLAHVAGALLMVPALTKGALWLGEWQQHVFPYPPGIEAQMNGMEAFLGTASTMWLVFFFAISPGVTEELVFRGSLLSAMKRDWTWPRIMAWQALYFALVHADLYRLLPTGIMGALLTLIALRARSVLPTIALHVAYNAVLVLGAAERLPFSDAEWFEYAPWAAIPGVLLFVLVPPRAKAEPKKDRDVD